MTKKTTKASAAKTLDAAFNEVEVIAEALEHFHYQLLNTPDVDAHISLFPKLVGLRLDQLAADARAKLAAMAKGAA